MPLDGVTHIDLLEIILGIDNIVFFINGLENLREKDQPKAKNWVTVGHGFRIILVWYQLGTGLQDVIYHVNLSFFEAHFTGQSLIILAVDCFFLYKSVTEIHHKLEAKKKALKENLKFFGSSCSSNCFVEHRIFF